MTLAARDPYVRAPIAMAVAHRLTSRYGLGRRTTLAQLRRVIALIDVGWAPYRITKEPGLPSEMVIYAIRKEYRQEQASRQERQEGLL